MVPATRCRGLVAGQIKDFALFPPLQKTASFNPDAVLAQVQSVSGVSKAKGAAAEKKEPAPVAD